MNNISLDVNNRYSTLSQAQKKLYDEGYTSSFNLLSKNEMTDGDTVYKPDDMAIAEFHRFEGMSNPADTSIIYALEADDGTKGVVIDTYGAESSKKLADFLIACED